MKEKKYRISLTEPRLELRRNSYEDNKQVLYEFRRGSRICL